MLELALPLFRSGMRTADSFAGAELNVLLYRVLSLVKDAVEGGIHRVVVGAAQRTVHRSQQIFLVACLPEARTRHRIL